jgi:catechol 2,3-dioxygenase-like lactoylglutathione lyase family enzyme
MIRGVHTMFYSSKPDEFRAFLRDKLGLTSYTDVGEGWLIFDLPEADMGCHPASPEEGGASGTPAISFYCDDVHKTVAELKGRGVEFVDSVTHFRAPGDFVLQLYQPRYVKKRAAQTANR